MNRCLPDYGLHEQRFARLCGLYEQMFAGLCGMYEQMFAGVYHSKVT
jgi:hypothetical protein